MAYAIDNTRGQPLATLQAGTTTQIGGLTLIGKNYTCLLYTSPSPRDATLSRMPSSA